MCQRKTVSSWIERLQELREGYSSENIWNMDESGCFFKALLDAGLIQKGEKAKGGKKSKQRFTIAFFVSAAGQKIDEPIVIWKSKLPRCFKRPFKARKCPLIFKFKIMDDVRNF